MSGQHQVCISGVGLVSSAGNSASGPFPMASDLHFEAGSPIRVIRDLDFDRQIPKRGDRRAMLSTMLYGVTAAGMALDDAHMRDRPGEEIDINIACDGAERDLEIDMRLLSVASQLDDSSPIAVNELLMNELRPTLFLAQIPNLLAGNVSIVQGVCRTSRTFMGGELAGAQALSDAYSRIQRGESQAILVGAAFNAERHEILESLRLMGWLAPRAVASVWDGPDRGVVPGSVAACVVLEPLAAALQRGVRPVALLDRVQVCWSDRSDVSWTDRLFKLLVAELPALAGRQWAVLSGTSGRPDLADAELRAIRAELSGRPGFAGLRAPVSMIGHGFEATLLATLAVGCMALRSRQLFPAMERTEHELSTGAKQLDALLSTCVSKLEGEAAVVVRAYDGEGTP